MIDYFEIHPHLNFDSTTQAAPVILSQHFVENQRISEVIVL